MNDVTQWDSGKTARQACFSVLFIDIQRIFLFMERFWSISITFIFLCLYDVHGVCESKQILPLPRKALGSIGHGLCFLPDNVFSNSYTRNASGTPIKGNQIITGF